MSNIGRIQNRPRYWTYKAFSEEKKRERKILLNSLPKELFLKIRIAESRTLGTEDHSFVLSLKKQAEKKGRLSEKQMHWLDRFALGDFPRQLKDSLKAKAVEEILNRDKVKP